MLPYHTWCNISFECAALHHLLLDACSAALDHVVEHRAELRRFARLTWSIYLTLDRNVYQVAGIRHVIIQTIRAL